MRRRDALQLRALRLDFRNASRELASTRAAQAALEAEQTTLRERHELSEAALRALRADRPTEVVALRWRADETERLAAERASLQTRLEAVAAELSELSLRGEAQTLKVVQAQARVQHLRERVRRASLAARRALRKAEQQEALDELYQRYRQP